MIASIADYRVVRELGRGSMGIVYEVVHPETNERFAAKVMLGAEDRPDLVERFRREARAASLIASEHVVRVVEIGIAPQLTNTHFLVMELLEGATIRQIVAERGRFSPTWACAIVSQTAHALDHAHAAGIVHRDLKPENLFLHNANGKQMVKVLDFGVARVLDDDATAITTHGATIGTLQYMAPEQTRSEPNATGPRADVWAIGMTVIDLVTGEPYWGTTKPSALVPRLVAGDLIAPSARWSFLTPAFDAWFFRSCALDPSARFATPGEQAAALRGALEG
jgi:serine/threonine-protein kinase